MIFAEPEVCIKSGKTVRATAGQAKVAVAAGRIFALAFLFFAILLGAAVAAEHPVPLPKDFDFGKCTDCHSEIGKGKAVHSALAMGCDSCHELRYIGIVTIVGTKAKGRELCITCHSDKGKAQGGGNLHPPVAGTCTSCHDPHSSPNKFQLIKAPSGDKNENLCLTCHDKGVNVPAGGSRHAALDMGCDACHVTHKTGDPTKSEFRDHLVKPAPALCLDCHDVKDAGLLKAHQGQPFATADCTGCHDPHQSDSPKLMQAVLHPPFQAGACDTCHTAPKDGKVALTKATPKELCVTCHDDKAKFIDNAKVQHPGAMGDCTDCHSPHASRYPRMLKQPVGVCTQCHDDRAKEQQTKKFLHQPAFKDGCYLCHEPHGSNNAGLLRTANVDDLCLTCHNVKPAVKLSADRKTFTIFNGAVELPASYLDSIKSIEVNVQGKGHPQLNHPTRDVDDPSNPGHKLSCVSCHDPHASDNGKQMFRLAEGTKVLCVKCHHGNNGVVKGKLQ